MRAARCTLHWPHATAQRDARSLNRPTIVTEKLGRRCWIALLATHSTSLRPARGCIVVHSLLRLPTREGHRVDLLRLRLHCTGTALGSVLVTDSRDSDSSGGALVQDGAGGRLAMDVWRTQRSVEAGEAGGEGDDDAVQHAASNLEL